MILRELFMFLYLNSPSAISQRTTRWCPWSTILVIPALTSYPVLHRPLGLGRSLVTKLGGPGAVAPLAAVGVVFVWR